ncbi:MAG: cyanophycinase [Candidatus Thermoplasmatota archaeon]
MENIKIKVLFYIMSMSKGPLITIGGNIDHSRDRSVLAEFLDLVENRFNARPVIGILPTASQESKKIAEKYSDIFKKFDVDTITLNPDDRAEANSEAIVEKVFEAEAFFFTGGNQLRITTLLGGTDLLKAIREKHEDGAVIGGTSAGSVCLTDLMISYGESENALMSGVVELTRGLHFIPGAVLDTHFTARGRFPRLVHVVVENPVSLGIGLGEDTGAIWDLEENEFTVIGSRNIVVVDGKNITHTNVSEIEEDTPLHAEGITVDILSHGCGFDLEERKSWFPENNE